MMKKFVLIAATVLGSASAQAAVIGPAGCGLGNLVFGKDNQVLAATTNGSFGSQTFGITSGTSNCVSPGSMAQSIQFIDVNQEALVKDAARGEGETIVGLARLKGCADAGTFGKTMKSEFETLFPENQVVPTRVNETLNQMIRTNPELAKQCATLG